MFLPQFVDLEKKIFQTIKVVSITVFQLFILFPFQLIALIQLNLIPINFLLDSFTFHFGMKNIPLNI